MNYQLERIKYLNPLLPVLMRYGVEPDKKGFAHCPFHNEKTASFKVYSNNTYYCFGCGEHGDVIDFIKKIENLTFEEACERLSGEAKYSEQRKADQIARRRHKARSRQDELRRKYWEIFDRWLFNEWVISDVRPSSPADDACSYWLAALNRRGSLTHELELAEAEYIKGA